MSADYDVHVGLVAHCTYVQCTLYNVLHRIVYSRSPPWVDVVRKHSFLPLTMYAAAYEKLLINKICYANEMKFQIKFIIFRLRQSACFVSTIENEI